MLEFSFQEYREAEKAGLLDPSNKTDVSSDQRLEYMRKYHAKRLARAFNESVFGGARNIESILVRKDGSFEIKTRAPQAQAKLINEIRRLKRRRDRALAEYTTAKEDLDKELQARLKQIKLEIEQAEAGIRRIKKARKPVLTSKAVYNAMVRKEERTAACGTC